MTEIIDTTTPEQRREAAAILLRYLLDSNTPEGAEFRARNSKLAGDNADQREAVKWALDKIGEGR